MLIGINTEIVTSCLLLSYLVHLPLVTRCLTCLVVLQRDWGIDLIQIILKIFKNCKHFFIVTSEDSYYRSYVCGKLGTF